MASKPVIAINHENDLGQVIKPGDEVFIVTKCTGDIGIYFGTYLGKLRDDTNDEYEAGCTVIKQQPYTWRRHKVTGECYERDKHKPEHLVEPVHPEYPEALRNTSPWGTQSPEVRSIYDDYCAKTRAYNEAYRKFYDQYQFWIDQNFEDVTDYKPVRVTLQRNRIYLMNTSLKSLVHGKQRF